MFTRFVTVWASLAAASAEVVTLEELRAEALETIAADATAAEAAAPGLLARSLICNWVSLSTRATVEGSLAKNAVEPRMDIRIGPMRPPAPLVSPVDVKKSICDCTVAAREAAAAADVATVVEARPATLEETAAEAAAAEAVEAGLIRVIC